MSLFPITKRAASFVLKTYNLHDGVSNYMREDCDGVKAIRPLPLSIFNTGNETCSCFNCALTFTIFKLGQQTQTRNSDITTLNTKVTVMNDYIIITTQNAHSGIILGLGTDITIINLVKD